MKFNNKIIYIISREDWGDMLMSKQHYAIELSKAGNIVYFINHPDLRRQLRRGQIEILSTKYENLFVVKHRMIHPYFFKFKFKRLYYFLTSFHIFRIIKKTEKIPNVVWLFDIGNSLPLKYFPSESTKIYMPVDGPFGTQVEKDAPDGADLIISVTEQILEQYRSLPLPKYMINHGVSDIFINTNIEVGQSKPLRIGYSGSLVRSDLDIKVFLTIIKEHGNKIFEFWGEKDYMKSNIHLPQDVKESTKEFLEILHNLPNVIMHGAVSPGQLAEGLKRMDALLICYNIKNDQNHHKVLEYLGTGKVIISSFMSSYHNNPDLIEMVKAKDNNEELPGLFSTVINNLNVYNTAEKQQKRIFFAKQYTYESQLKKIEDFLN